MKFGLMVLQISAIAFILKEIFDNCTQIRIIEYLLNTESTVITGIFSAID
jgi:hypothetical protein